LKTTALACSTLFALTAAICTAPLAASAQDICDELHAQLNTLQAGTENTAPVRRFELAIAAQRGQIDALRMQGRALNCPTGSIMHVGSAEAGSCRQIANTLKRMNDVVAQLERERVIAASQTDKGAARERLEKALRDQQCQTIPRSASAIQPDHDAGSGHRNTVKVYGNRILDDRRAETALRRADTPLAGLNDRIIYDNIVIEAFEHWPEDDDPYPMPLPEAPSEHNSDLNQRQDRERQRSYSQEGSILRVPGRVTTPAPRTPIAPEAAPLRDPKPNVRVVGPTFLPDE